MPRDSKVPRNLSNTDRGTAPYTGRVEHFMVC